MSATRGKQLIEECKNHVLETLAAIPDCSLAGTGLRSKDIENEAGFALHLPEQDGWLTWSLLMALASEGKVEVSRTGGRGIRHLRLKAST